jgi:hypothetical protein
VTGLRRHRVPGRTLPHGPAPVVRAAAALNPPQPLPRTRRFTRDQRPTSRGCITPTSSGVSWCRWRNLHAGFAARLSVPPRGPRRDTEVWRRSPRKRPGPHPDSRVCVRVRSSSSASRPTPLRRVRTGSLWKAAPRGVIREPSRQTSAAGAPSGRSPVSGIASAAAPRWFPRLNFTPRRRRAVGGSELFSTARLPRSRLTGLMSWVRGFFPGAHARRDGRQ